MTEKELARIRDHVYLCQKNYLCWCCKTVGKPLLNLVDELKEKIKELKEGK